MNKNTIDTDMLALVKHFNDTTTFEKVVSLNEYDVANLTASIRELGAEKIKEAFARANSSRFLTGRKGYEWKASFGWIIHPDHISSILNGKYDDYVRAKKTVDCIPVPSSDDDEFIKAALSRGLSDLLE